MVYLFFLIVRSLGRLLAGWRSDSGAKDLEILVLRHQLKVLGRKAGRPSSDRLTERCSPRRAGSCPGIAGARSS
jgi:hypothetical protein